MDLNDLIGDAKSLMDLTEEVVEAPKVDLMGEAEETDQIDFSGEAVGVLDVELEREVIPDFAWPATEMGAVAHDWKGLVEKTGLYEYGAGTLLVVPVLRSMIS